MRKIKVAFFADMLLEKLDGYSRTIQQLIRHIPKDQFEFLFLTGSDTEGAIENFESIYIPSIPIPTNKPYKMAIPHLIRRKLTNQIDAFAPDVIHIANPSLLGKFACEYAMAHQIPTVSIYHTHYISYVKYYLRNLPSLIPAGERYVSHVSKLIYDQCDIVYIPVREIADNLNKLGFKTNHFKIWQRGIDLDMFSPRKRSLSYMYNITGNKKKNLLFASRLVWEKNLKTLIAVYNMIDHTAYNMVIAGSGAAMEELQLRMPCAIFLGNVKHDVLSIIYASSDVFLFPSDTESFGNVVLEAMASGLPVVSANAGGPVGILVDGESGFLCDSHKPTEYVERLELLLRNDVLRRQIINKALLHVKSFSWQQLADIYCNDLKNLSQSYYSVYA